MCVGTAATIGIVTAGASVAGSQIAAKQGRDAAGAAAATQTAAGDRALELQRQRYAQERADFDPYRQAGRQAIGGLQAQVAGPTAPAFRPDGPPQALGRPPQLGLPIGARPPAGPAGPAPPGPMRPPGAGLLHPQVGGSRPMIPPGAAPTAEGLWTIQAPDGETRQLPPEHAQAFMQRGARRIG